MKNNINIRLSDVKKSQLQELAEAEKRTLSEFMRFILESFAECEIPARWAVIEILKNGKDPDFSKKIAAFIILRERGTLKIDEIFYEKIKEKLGG